jgi:hypothetical protein
MTAVETDTLLMSVDIYGWIENKDLQILLFFVANDSVSVTAWFSCSEKQTLNNITPNATIAYDPELGPSNSDAHKYFRKIHLNVNFPFLSRFSIFICV